MSKHTQGWWTTFHDMHSGGNRKIGYDRIYIKARLKRAVSIFESKFDRDPFNVTCGCCGEDYSVDEHCGLIQATGFDRGCAVKNGKYIEKPNDMSWGPYITLDEYMKLDNVLFIYKAKETK